LFLKNKAIENGGAIYIKNQNLEISDNIYQENEANQGGAIYYHSTS